MSDSFGPIARRYFRRALLCITSLLLAVWIEQPAFATQRSPRILTLHMESPFPSGIGDTVLDNLNLAGAEYFLSVGGDYRLLNALWESGAHLAGVYASPAASLDPGNWSSHVSPTGAFIWNRQPLIEVRSAVQDRLLDAEEWGAAVSRNVGEAKLDVVTTHDYLTIRPGALLAQPPGRVWAHAMKGTVLKKPARADAAPEIFRARLFDELIAVSRADTLMVEPEMGRYIGAWLEAAKTARRQGHLVTLPDWLQQNVERRLDAGEPSLLEMPTLVHPDFERDFSPGDERATKALLRALVNVYGQPVQGVNVQHPILLSLHAPSERSKNDQLVPALLALRDFDPAFKAIVRVDEAEWRRSLAGGSPRSDGGNRVLDELRDAVFRAGLEEHVAFHPGTISRLDMTKLYRAIAAGNRSSVSFQSNQPNYSLGIVEALRSGLPVVTAHGHGAAVLGDGAPGHVASFDPNVEGNVERASLALVGHRGDGARDATRAFGVERSAPAVFARKFLARVAELRRPGVSASRSAPVAGQWGYQPVSQPLYGAMYRSFREVLGTSHD